jgi:hypothetical protein
MCANPKPNSLPISHPPRRPGIQPCGRRRRIDLGIWHTSARAASGQPATARAACASGELECSTVYSGLQRSAKCAAASPPLQARPPPGPSPPPAHLQVHPCSPPSPPPQARPPPVRRLLPPPSRRRKLPHLAAPPQNRSSMALLSGANEDGR